MMGNLNSYQTSDSSGSDSMENNENKSSEQNSNSSAENDENLDEFKGDLMKKREQRLTKLNEIKNELNELRLENEVLKKKLLDVENSSENSFAISDEIRLKKMLSELQYELQIANAENISLSTELDVTRKQVSSLKEVIEVSKKMIAIREDQVNQLKEKLKEIEESFNERELKIMSDDLRREYNRQLENIKNLKSLYEERARVSGIERDNLQKELTATKSELNVEIERSKNLTESLGETVASLTETKTKLDSMTYDKRQLETEMTAINELSSKILTGFKSETDVNLDRLSKVLEENRGLLIDMTNQNEGSIVSTSDASILPKLLFDLVVQADRHDDHENYINNDSGGGTMVVDTGGGLTLTKIQSTEEIMMNLPKVWRILMEFLSHQTCDFNQVECADDTNPPPPNCNNEVALSVSKTFIKLKDLILEKKSLQKETNRLKTLNGHLDKRLKSQEKRLSVVSLELTKTWHLVGRMQRQHRQLHTNEQILRYQLQQKRRMLNELKDELEYCRRKWAMAKEKNNESEDQWRILHNEFESRKRIGATKITDVTNSAESGYDDDIDETDVEKDESGPKLVPIKFNRSNSLTQIGSKSPRSSRRGNSEPMDFSLVNDDEDDGDGDDEEEEEPVMPTNSADESLEAMFIRLQSLHTVVENRPSTSTPTNKSVLTKKEEEYTTRRAERLQRLEEQCKALKAQCANNLSRGDEMSSQLDTIHDRYNKTGHVAETPTSINEPGTSTSSSESPTTETNTENSENCDEN